MTPSLVNHNFFIHSENQSTAYHLKLLFLQQNTKKYFET